MKNASLIISLLLVTHMAYGTEQEQTNRYVNQHKLSTGMTVVVTEGEFEPRSMGSYSIRIYGANPEFPADDFLCGAVRARDGVVEKVIIQDINKDGTEEIIIIIRYVGTGGYLSADAFQYQSKLLELKANVDTQSIDNFRKLSRSFVINVLQRERFYRLTLDFDGSVLSTKRNAQGSAAG